MPHRKPARLSRRSFIGLGSAAVAGAAAAGLAGCSPKDIPGDSATQAGGAGAGGYAWQTKPEPITDIAQTKSFDIVIVGAGMAGTAAAEAAARNGAKVAVIEQMETFSVRGVDNGCLNNSWQQKNGISVPQETAVRLLYQWSQQTANYNLLNTWATRSGKVFDYLEEMTAKHGITMIQAVSPTAKYGWEDNDERWRVYPDAVSFTAEGDVGMMAGDGVHWMNLHLVQAFVDEASANGAEFFYETRAEQLVGDSASGISGVIAKAADGSYTQYNASKGVIMATGDIGGNPDLLECFCPIVETADVNLYIPPGANTGQGLIMGLWAGAAPSKSPAAPMVHQFTTDNVGLSLTSFAMCWLAVNRNGERYGAEMPFEPYLTNARLNTPGSIAWSIFDSDYPKYVQAQFPASYEAILEKIPAQIEQYTANGILIQADTLDELAQKIEVPAEALNKTVEVYNQWLPAGQDSQFGVPPRWLSQVQTAPFYATKNVASILTVPFGLHVDDNSQVCTQQDEPIKGLFAIGNVQGDFFGLSYPVNCPGVSHGRCITFGQLVGEALAKDTVIAKTA
ncbi:MAG: FAD-dependent oxidoreductase [Bifidobacteriaceae bacterium]|nr:FAD-dependent oxidoreductase [Bifidobacteriaceae bacterium]